MCGFVCKNYIFEIVFVRLSYNYFLVAVGLLSAPFGSSFTFLTLGVCLSTGFFELSCRGGTLAVKCRVKH